MTQLKLTTDEVDVQTRLAWKGQHYRSSTKCAGCKTMQHCAGQTRGKMLCLVCYAARVAKRTRSTRRRVAK